MRILGIDLGTRRVGLALSDALRVIASPLKTVQRSRQDDALISEIESVCVEHEVSEIVIGLPRHMDGREGEGAADARKIAARLQKPDRKIILWDERMSTLHAARGLREMGVKREKQRAAIDQAAAQVILEGYLQRLAMQAPHDEAEE